MHIDLNTIDSVMSFCSKMMLNPLNQSKLLLGQTILGQVKKNN